MFNHHYALVPADIPAFTSPMRSNLKAHAVKPESERERLVRLAQQDQCSEVSNIKPRYLKCA
jgi:hypothetical protein